MGSVVLITGVLLMVVIHEAAHFIAAKAFGIKATEAFFGFGPRIWSMKRGETEYGIKAIPLGGYVRIIGMNPLEEIDPEEEHRTYRGKPFWQKAVVVLAGIGSHFVVAFILFFVVIVVWGRTGGPSTEIAAVTTVLATSSGIADEDPLDLLPGDEIVTIDGVPLLEGSPLWQKQPGEVTIIEIDRDGEIITDTTTERVVVAPSFLAGIQPGDVFVEFDGVPIDTWDTFVDIAHDHPAQAVEVVMDRDGQLIEFESVLAVNGFNDQAVGYFGVSPTALDLDVGLFSGMGYAWEDLAAVTQGSFVGLYELVTNLGDIFGAVFGNESIPFEEARPISVIGLARIAGPVQDALIWLALVNVFVGVLNVIPLYPLDGGHFAVALYERIRGREADVRKLLPVAAVVFVFIVMLGLLGIYLDIVDPLQLPG